jgi:hypothetical protein
MLIMRICASRAFAKSALLAALWITLPCPCPAAPEPGSGESPRLWELAKQKSSVHCYSTLFTAHDVKWNLAREDGLQKAIAWCKATGVTKVYLEAFRDNYQAEAETLKHARQAFEQAGFAVSGCVTTTRVGKASTGWKEVAGCYTDPVTQQKLQSIFEYAASLFDEIMIDDFWFTDCACAECEAARKARTVQVGDQSCAVSGDTWEAYRCELMVRLSRDRILAPAKRVNPRARLIIKYPQWYDDFHNRGYEVSRETVDFDRIWVGTETRDYEDRRWGGTAPYEGYFIMRWLGGIGGAKCGGGWYDSLGTTEQTYIEQARQTILGGGRESMLFCYGGLQRDHGPKDIEALRTNLPELLSVATQLQGHEPVGIAAYKPVNSHPRNEGRVFDYVGMMGLPLVPCHEFPTNAPAAFFSLHALKDPDFAAKLATFVQTGKPVLLTDGLRQALPADLKLNAPNVTTLEVRGNPKRLLASTSQELEAVRAPLLRALKVSFSAPNKVALYWFKGGGYVVENFNDNSAQVTLNGKTLEVAGRGWAYAFK